MKKVNLRELYPDVYKTDHFVEVTEDVLETIRAAERAEAAYDRRMYRYKAHYSLDCDNGIENAIHTFAGIQLRLACAELMRRQGHEEETGRAKITPAFNLPCRYVLHTVGPIVAGPLTQKDRELLASCYRSCLELAGQNGIRSVAFCCISTGEFHFPNERAAEIAIRTVKDYRKHAQNKIEVIFNVFKETDLNIYRKLLGAD